MPTIFDWMLDIVMYICNLHCCLLVLLHSLNSNGLFSGTWLGNWWGVYLAAFEIFSSFTLFFLSLTNPVFVVYSQSHAAILSLFSTPRKKPLTRQKSFPISFPAPPNTNLLISLRICLFGTFHISKIMPYVFFCDKELNS